MYKLLLCWRYLALLSVCLVTGCGTVRTEQSLSEVGTVIADEALTGIWHEPVNPAFAGVDEEEQGSVMEVTLLDDDTYRVTFRDEQGREDGTVIGRCFEVQDKCFFEVISLAENQAGKLVLSSAEEIKLPNFISIAREGDFLLIRWPDANAFAKLIERSDEIEGSAAGWPAKTVMITSKPTTNAKHLIKHHDILFRKPTRFRLKSQNGIEKKQAVKTAVPISGHKLKTNCD